MMNAGTAMTIGTLVAMIALQEQMLFPLEEVLRTGVEARKARALFARIFEYLDKPAGVTERPDAVTLDPSQVAGHVRLDGVTFSYDRSGPATLRAITVDIPAGSHTAIVGATGSASPPSATSWHASTTSMRRRALRRRRRAGPERRLALRHPRSRDAGPVPPPRQHRREPSVRPARSHGGADGRGGAHCPVARPHRGPAGRVRHGGGRAGAPLLGGERQRLSLARTILRDPRVLLLDEATSSLDTATERAVVEALARPGKPHTTITIAHRLSTVRRADQIVVLDRGTVVESGTHETLLARDGAYACLVRKAA